ncbi:MAG: hypothetical protein KatS3mg129_0502 [Leptospiraceae bacterium]|nr:MAG: hypothetical protein KatS3mg129_0502 [Leptospiraceae bacterium]
MFTVIIQLMIFKKIYLFIFKLKRNVYELNEKIPIQFVIRNQGYKTFRFYLDQNFGNSFFLEIINQEGEEIQSQTVIMNFKEPYISNIKQNQIEDIYGNPVKEIILHPEETFSKTYYISSLPKGRYKLIGYFIPYSYDQQYKNNLRFISKNKINLEITEEKNLFKIQDPIDIPKESIPSPEETVYLFLMAEYYKNWNNYFKYLELKEYIKSYEIFEKEYIQASLKEKQILLNEFKNFLIKQQIEPIIEFNITKVIYQEKNKANVYAEVLRGNNSYRVKYLYNYTLIKKDVWKIHHVVVSILKTGK